MADSKFGLPNLKIGTQTWNSKFGLPNLKIGQIPNLGTTYILYIENPLKSNHFSINPLFLLTDTEIHGIPPVHTKENQQNTKCKKYHK